MKIFGAFLILYGLYAIYYWVNIYRYPDKCCVKFGPWGERLFYKAPQKERYKMIRRTAVWSMIGGILCISIGGSILYVF